ncbi:sterol desaturase family protein [Mycobacterium sp. Y57]|uniref:sterol desaturase family protein n=1 Tax=Mycolicibacterium xanthum TaxID=2796469 RepID=UPI001C842500|nr:sterol desaturase family protein [Mycolicibacterium xanthum]MBX7435096.1 sterol desaturase family protein [Mycolicibacterium xanthum]
MISIYAIPAFLVLMAIEYFGYYRERREARRTGVPPARATAGLSVRDTTTSLSVYAIGRVVKPLDKFIELPLVAIAGALSPLALSASDWWLWVLALVLADLAYYVKHRMSHRIRLFWAGHSVHHSSERFNLSTAVRLPWLIPGSFLMSVVYVPLALIGIPLWMIFLAQSVVLLFQYPIHTERIGRLPGPVEFVFNTPSHHRVHHGANNPYLDKNYGGILIVWDRMFGSYAEEIEPVRFGLTKNIDTYNPIKVNYHEFATMLRDVWRAQSWRGRIGYLVQPPGWAERADTPATANRVLEPVG